MAQRIKAELMHVDILVQNAAMYAAALIENADLSDFDKLCIKQRCGLPTH